MKFSLCLCFNFTFLLTCCILALSPKSITSMICGIIHTELINTKPTHVSLKAYRCLYNSILSTLFCKDCKFSYSCVICITVTAKLRLEGMAAEHRANFEARSSFRALFQSHLCISKNRYSTASLLFPHSQSNVWPPSL